MIVHRCDGCGRDIPERSLRYTVKVDVRAAYEKVEVGLADLVRDHRRELEELIRKMGEQSAKELEESVYKHLEFDLCPSCQKAYIQDPLRFQPGREADTPDTVDAFLRSLGYGDADPSSDE